VSTTLTNLKVFTINFDVDLHGMDRRLRATFSRAILQWLLEATARAALTAAASTTTATAQRHQEEFLHPRQAQEHT
jgi:hypothetical protein